MRRVKQNNIILLSTLLSSISLVYAAPHGGVVSSGQATISQNNKITNINQSTNKASINWNSFSIASNETVNFNQPNSSSITLNRVIGNEKSIINGALNANGQVWLLNSNGVLFGKNASINTAGLLATTSQLSDTNFQNGNHNFRNSSTNSVINEGTIEVVNNGSVILASNEVRNSGTIKAIKGKVHLVGASDYTINLNGNSLVNLKVDKGVLDSMVENSGTIIADGGEIYLTTNAVNELLKGVVNNTGIIEANSLDGLTGKVELFAHGGTGEFAGKVHAKDGFVETSGKYFDFLGADIQAGEWLIDPVDITIDSTLASAIETALENNADVKIETDTPDHSDVDTTSGESAGSGDITVSSAISWNTAQKLTLDAANDIFINASITASHANGKVELLYGQGAVSAGNSANYYVNSTVNLKAGDNFITKLGNDGTLTTWKVITALGSEGSLNDGTLQGINGNLSGNYVLGSNIDASDTSSWYSNAGWKPIGDYTNYFTGIFDGLGHTVSNLFMDTLNTSTTSRSLFGYTSAASVLKNIGVTNVDITAQGSYFGGLVGFNEGTIINSYATGVINANGGNHVGGLVGYMTDTGTISNSYATVEVTGDNEVGGLLGRNLSGTVSNSYAAGKVTGVSDVGGLIGVEISCRRCSSSSALATGSYWDTQTSGQSSSAGGTGLTTDEFSNLNNFSDWDSTVWSFGTGDSEEGYGVAKRPYLKNVTQPSDLEPTIRTLFNSGYGTEIAPYTITSWQQLANIDTKNVVNGSYHFDLTQNLDSSTVGYTELASSTANSNAGWEPIGDSTNQFTGTFDGLGNTVDGLFIENSAIRVALFSVSQTNSIIKNIGVTNIDITGGLNTAGLVAFNNGTISNSYVTGTVVGADYLGGLVAVNHGTINNSYSTASVNLMEGQSARNLGGLVGYNNGGINNSYSTASITPNDAFSVGGIVGYNDAEATITNSFFTGSMGILRAHQNSGDGNSSGIVGESVLGSTVTNSYWNKDTIGYYLNDDGNGLTATEMQKQSSFTGFDFVNDWLIYNDKTTPLLRSFMEELTITANDATKIYDGSAYNGGSGYTSSIASPSNLLLGSIVYSGDSQGATNAGTYDITPTGLYSTEQNGGYAITFVDGTLAINERVITAITSITGIAAEDKTYDGTTTAILDTSGANFIGMIGGDTLNVATSIGNFDNKNVGVDKIVNITGLSLGGTDAGNYNLANTTATTTADINKASLTVTADDKTKTYGDVNPALTTSLSGFVGAETLATSGVTGSGSATTTADETTDAGTAVIKAGVGTLAASNYDFANLVDGTLNINQKDLTASYTAANKTYDGTTDAVVTESTNDIINGDTVTISESAAFDNKNAATGKTVNVSSITLGGTDAGNYNLANTTATTTADINKASLTVTADDKTKTYGDVNPALTTSLSGFVGAETLATSGVTGSGSATTTADETTDAGTAVIKAGVGTLAASNYDFANLVDGTLNINQKDLTASYTAANKTYDGTTDAVVTESTNDIINGDTVTISESAAFDNKNAATGKTVNVSSITLGGTDAGNYNLTNTTATTTADINKASLTVTADDKTKTYGDVNPALTTSLSGFVGAETLATSGVTGSGSATTTADETTDAGTAVIKAGVGTLAASNYDFANLVDGTLNINQKDLTASYTAANKTYDGTTDAVVTESTNDIINGDTVTISESAAFDNKNAATGKTVNVSSITLGGTDAGNYNLANTTATTTADIAKKDVEVTYTANNKTYDGTTDAIVIEATNDLISGDTVTISESAAFDNKNAATGKTVNVSSITLGGTDAGNYNLANTTATTTADINPVVQTSTNKDVNNVVTAIANNTATNVKAPKAQQFTKPVTLANTNIAQRQTFNNPNLNQLVSTPITSQTVKRVSLSEAKQMQIQNGIDTLELRVQLSQNSSIELINGGVKLPDGIEQEFYIAMEN